MDRPSPRHPTSDSYGSVETMPKRRKTTIGRGALGQHVPVDLHADETLRRVLRAGRPLTEDAMFLALRNVLR